MENSFHSETSDLISFEEVAILPLLLQVFIKAFRVSKTVGIKCGSRRNPE